MPPQVRTTPRKRPRQARSRATVDTVLEATSRGLFVHQMIGILPDKAREVYAIPEHSQALTGIAIGYLGDGADLPEKRRLLDTSPRTRKPLAEFVFTGKWGKSASILS